MFQVPVWISCIVHAYSILGHIYSHWQGWSFHCIAFKFELLLVQMTQCTRYNICLWKGVYVCTCKSRTCNIIHLSLVFFSPHAYPLQLMYHSQVIHKSGQPWLWLIHRACYLLSMFKSIKSNWEPDIIQFFSSLFWICRQMLLKKERNLVYLMFFNRYFWQAIIFP